MAQHDNTKETTPYTIWLDSVLARAKVSVEDMEKYATRERLVRWYQAGEPVWMSAGSLSFFVVQGKKHDRADNEVADLKRRLSNIECHDVCAELGAKVLV